MIDHADHRDLTKYNPHDLTVYITLNKIYKIVELISVFAASAAGEDAAVSPPARQLVQKVSGCRRMGFVELLWRICTFDGGAAAGALVIGSCTVMAVTLTLYIDHMDEIEHIDHIHHIQHVPY